MLTLAHADVAGLPAEPVAAAGLALVAALYVRGRRASAAAGRLRAAAFWGALAVLAVALVSPIAATADELLSAHMGQHLLLVAVAAPLAALARPGGALLRGLPRAPRRAAGRLRGLGARGRRAAGAGAVAVALVALHAAALWAWHLPGLYERALASGELHALEHLTLFGTGLLLWAAVAGAGGPRRIGHAAAIVAVLATALHSGLLGTVMTFSREPWFDAHAAGAAARGLSPLADQQLAGVLMWVPGGAVHVLAAVALAAALTRAPGRRPAAEARP